MIVPSVTEKWYNGWTPWREPSPPTSAFGKYKLKSGSDIQLYVYTIRLGTSSSYKSLTPTNTHGTIVGLSGSRSLMGQLNQQGIGVVHTHDKTSPNLAGQGRELKDFNGYLLV